MSLWNGKQAAMSLTFDDGRVSQIEFAVPEMTKRGIFGTFFLVGDPNTRKQFDPDSEKHGDDWCRAASHGHEIGSHSMTHSKAEELDFEDGYYEAQESKKALQSYCSVTAKSFCYPYTDVNEAIRRPVVKEYGQARGGRVARKDKFLRPESDFDMHNIPCLHIGSSNFHVNVIPSIILEALDRQAWVTLMFHTIGPLDEERDVRPWDIVSVEQFQGMLDGLLVAQRAGLWVAPFGTVAENIRQNR